MKGQWLYHVMYVLCKHPSWVLYATSSLVGPACWLSLAFCLAGMCFWMVIVSCLPKWRWMCRNLWLLPSRNIAYYTMVRVTSIAVPHLYISPCLPWAWSAQKGIRSLCWKRLHTPCFRVLLKAGNVHKSIKKWGGGGGDRIFFAQIAWPESITLKSQVLVKLSSSSLASNTLGTQ